MTEAGCRKAILGVALASALLCLPFLGSYPLFDPDEGYYPAAAAESLREGHPLDLTLNGEPRWNKPPLSYALMQVSMCVLGKNEFAVRLPSVLEGAALVAVVGLLTAGVAGGAAGLLAAAVLASSVGHQVMTRAAHPEMGLVLGTAAAQLLFATWFVSSAETRPRRTWWQAGLAMGFGFLAKGPSTLLMPALMLVAGMLVVSREGRPSWGAVGRVFGLASLVCLALAAPWFLWMGAKHGSEFWRTVFGQLENYSENDRGGFRANPLFFVPVLVGAFLPLIAFLPAALGGLRPTDPSPPARFSLLMALAAGTSFLFWSLSTSKNPHYALVLLPPLAVIVAQNLASTADPRRIRPAAILMSVSVLSVVGTVALCHDGFLLAKVHPAFAVREIAGVIQSRQESSAPALAVYRRRLPSLLFRSAPWAWECSDGEDLNDFGCTHFSRPRLVVIHRKDLGVLAAVERGYRVLYEDHDSGLILLEWSLTPSPPPSPPSPLRSAPGAAPPGGGPR